MKENCAECRHHDVFWDGSGCNLLNSSENCKFEPRSNQRKNVDMDLLPYQVYNAAGVLIEQAPESCRKSRRIELDLLENGYTIRLHGRKITKKELTGSAKGGK